jgi:hypothetical protein
MEQMPLAPPCQPIEGDTHSCLLGPEQLAGELGYSVTSQRLDGSVDGWCDSAKREIVVNSVPAAIGNIPNTTPTPRWDRPATKNLRCAGPFRMRLVGQLSNPSLAQKRALEAFPSGIPQEGRRASAKPATSRRLGNGAVQRAIVRVLTGGAPMRRADIRASVENLLGQPVSIETVSWCLCVGTRKHPPVFERVAHGEYQLGPQT